jgi:hypothetical protein
MKVPYYRWSEAFGQAGHSKALIAVCASRKWVENLRQFGCGRFHQWTSMNDPKEG